VTIEELLQRLSDHSRNGPAGPGSVLTHPRRQQARQPDGEHRAGRRHQHRTASCGLLDVTTCLPLGQPETRREHPSRLGDRQAQELHRRVDPLGVLLSASATTTSHDTNILQFMSFTACDTPRPLQAPIPQHDLELEVANCVGGVLSPLLANIALSALDEHFISAWNQQMATEVQRQRRKRQGKANYRLVRYADDFVVLVTGQREHADQLRAEVATVLAPMGLRLSPEKTRVVHIDDGFDFLGFNIRRMRRRGSNKWFVYTRPSKKAIASIKGRVKTMTYRATLHHDPGYLMDYLGRVLRGWANYFRHGVSKATFSAIDSYAWERITSWLRDKHKIGWPELRRRFCLPDTWRLVVDGKRFKGAASVPIIRYRYRGYRIPTPWTPSAPPAEQQPHVESPVR